MPQAVQGKALPPLMRAAARARSTPIFPAQVISGFEDATDASSKKNGIEWPGWTMPLT